MHPIISNKSVNGIRSVLPYPASKVRCDADIQRAVALARKDVDARPLLSHAPACGPWVPAFAGTTGYFSSLSEHRVGDFLGGHQGREIGVGAWHRRKQRGVDDAQTGDP